MGGPDFDYLLSMPMWNLTMEKKDEVEAKENEEEAENVPNPAGGASKGAKKGKGKKAVTKMETKPSALAVRIEPQVSADMKEKVAKAVAAKIRKAAKSDKSKTIGIAKSEKEKGEAKDEFDQMTENKGGLKQSKLNFKPATKTKNKEQWGDDESSENEALPKKENENPWDDSGDS